MLCEKDAATIFSHSFVDASRYRNAPPCTHEHALIPLARRTSNYFMVAPLHVNLWDPLALI